MYLGASAGRLHIGYEEHLDEVSEVADFRAGPDVTQRMMKGL